MLHPTDEAFLTHAVRSGRIPEDRAAELAGRYQGEPGRLPDALIQSGVLTPADRDHLLSELHDRAGHLPRTHAGMPTPALPDTRSGSTAGPPRRSRSARLPTRIPGYSVERELGRGGMGAVYLAQHIETGRQVAIKVLLNAGEHQVRRFEREVHAMARLKHPHIVELLDSGQTPRCPYLVMAYHEGGDLEEALQANTLDRPRLLKLAADAARALAYAHAQGVLHRDLKPANILLDADGHVRVTDFGLAKIVDRETRLTRTNAAVGTPNYMAPEQVRGDEYSAAVDSYGLGVVLYRALTGELPFDSTDRIELYATILGTPPRPPWEVADVPRDIGQLVLWALEKDPADRPTCAMIAAALDRHLTEGDAAALPPSMLRQRRRFWFIGAGAVLGIALAVFVIGVASWQHDAAAERQAAQADAALGEAISQARRARGGRDLPALLLELEAHAAVEAALGEVPYGALPAALERVAASRQRHVEAIGFAIPLLLADDRVDVAVALARRRAGIDPGAPSQVALASVLAARRDTAPEAFEIAQAASEAQLDADTRAELAKTYLRLHRPARACAVLVDAPEELLALRARARDLAGDLPGAAADARAASEAAPDDTALRVQRIGLVLRAGGDPGDALRMLARVRAGALAKWHLVSAQCQERLGHPAATKAAYVEASKLDPGLLPALASMHLRRGRRLAALAVLGELKSPRARLDRAIAGWVAGADGPTTIDALTGVANDADAFAASPALAAAAYRWTARVEVCRHRLEEAEAAAQRAWDAEPGPRSAATLAWTRWRRADRPGARAALAATQARTTEGLWLEAQLDLEDGARDAARDRLADLPPGFPGRLELELGLTFVGGERERLTNSLYWSWFTGTPGRPAPVPVASAEGEQPLTWATRYLLHAGRRALTGEDERGQILLRRAVQLVPSNLPARLGLAGSTKDLQSISELVAAHPTLMEARRVRLQIRSRRAKEDGEEKPVGEMLTDGIAMAKAEALFPSEYAAMATLLKDKAKDVESAWAIVQPALRGEPRNLSAYRVGADLARLRGDNETAERLDVAVAEISETRRRQSSLYEEAFYNEDHDRLPKALSALRRLARDTEVNANYWRLRAAAQFGQAAFGRATVSGGEFLVDCWNLKPYHLSMWIHGFSWNPQLRPEVVDELTAEQVAEKPGDAAPWLARAMYLAAQYNLRRPSPDPEDLERAADLALYATQCVPTAPGALAFSANLLVSAREPQAARDLVHRALSRDPRCEFATFQLAREAAARGDVEQVIEVLRGITQLGKPGNMRQLREDPIFAAVLEDPLYVDFLSSVPPE